MNVYFIRHGESEGNISDLEHNDGGLSLTERGKEQAGFVGKRFVSIPIDIIITSSYERAKQTANIIGNIIKKEIAPSPLFGERLLPTAMIGKRTDDEFVMNLHAQLRNNFLKENARHSDEENFEDLKERARKALDFIKNQPHQNILVVSHTGFIRTILAYMIFGETLNAREFFYVHRSFKIKNTAITKVEHRKRTASHDFEWYIEVWNDHAHLGEIK